MFPWNPSRQLLPYYFIVVGGSPTTYQNHAAHDIRLPGGM
jgi:hypothetical protein